MHSVSTGLYKLAVQPSKLRRRRPLSRAAIKNEPSETHSAISDSQNLQATLENPENSAEKSSEEENPAKRARSELTDIPYDWTSEYPPHPRRDADPFYSDVSSCEGDWFDSDTSVSPNSSSLGSGTSSLSTDSISEEKPRVELKRELVLKLSGQLTEMAALLRECCLR